LAWSVSTVGTAALGDGIDYPLHSVDAFEIGHFRRVAGVDQGFEARAHQFGEPATQNRLFAEQVSFRLFAEIGFQDCCPAATEGGAIGKGDLFGIPGGILGYSNQAWDSLTLLKLAA